MLWKTHVVGGIVAGALIAPHITGDIKAQALFIACAGVGALLPDIDSFHSKLGRIIMPVSVVVQLIFGHRGIFHTILLPMALYMGLNLLLPMYSAYYLPLLVGYISHLLLDVLTPEGTPLLWPLPKHISIPLAQTGGIIEKAIFLGLTVASITLIYGIGGGII